MVGSPTAGGKVFSSEPDGLICFSASGFLMDAVYRPHGLVRAPFRSVGWDDGVIRGGEV